MIESRNGHRPLELTPKHIFADVNGSENFAFSHIGRLLAGLSSNQDALNRLYEIKKKEEEEGRRDLSPDFIAHEEQMQEERWKIPSRMLSLVFKVPLETIDKKEILSQFNSLSKQRVDKLSVLKRPVSVESFIS